MEQQECGELLAIQHFFNTRRLSILHTTIDFFLSLEPGSSGIEVCIFVLLRLKGFSTIVPFIILAKGELVNKTTSFSFLLYCTISYGLQIDLCPVNHELRDSNAGSRMNGTTAKSNKAKRGGCAPKSTLQNRTKGRVLLPPSKVSQNQILHYNSENNKNQNHDRERSRLRHHERTACGRD